MLFRGVGGLFKGINMFFKGVNRLFIGVNRLFTSRFSPRSRITCMIAVLTAGEADVRAANASFSSIMHRTFEDEGRRKEEGGRRRKKEMIEHRNAFLC